MQKKNNGNSNNSGYNNRNPRNTDNEKTMYFSPASDNEDTAGFSTSEYDSYGRDGSYQSEYHGGGQTPGRRQYYNSAQEQSYNSGAQRNSQRPPQSGNGQRSPQQRRPVNQSGNAPRQGSQRNARPQQRPQGASRPNNANGQRRPQQGAYRPSGANAQRPRQQQNSAQRRPSGNRPPENYNPQRKRQQQPPQQSSSKGRNKRRTPFILKLLIVIVLLFAIVFGAYSCVALSMINKLNYQETGARTHYADAMYESYVTNVLLIGTDGRTADERGRSDTMILVSINSKTNKIFLTSFMRDSYVEIPGHGWNKLNASYSYGGAELLMDTIELNFNVRIDDYISINFNSFASIVDSVGGIEIEVSDAEAQEINTILMAEVNELMGDAVDSDLLNGGGTLKLNGKQALSYARIRHIGNADFERTERQRNVLTKVAEKLKSFNPSMITEIAQNAVPQVTTNMSKAELYALSLRLPFIIRYEFIQLRVPAEGLYGYTTTSDGGSALSIDFTPNINIIRENVFAKE